MFYEEELMVVVLHIIWFYVPPNVKQRWDLDLRFHPKAWKRQIRTHDPGLSQISLMDVHIINK